MEAQEAEKERQHLQLRNPSPVSSNPSPVAQNPSPNPGRGSGSPWLGQAPSEQNGTPSPCLSPPGVPSTPSTPQDSSSIDNQPEESKTEEEFATDKQSTKEIAHPGTGNHWCPDIWEMTPNYKVLAISCYLSESSFDVFYFILFYCF